MSQPQRNGSGVSRAPYGEDSGAVLEWDVMPSSISRKVSGKIFFARVKRGVDIGASLIGLILLAPIFAVIALVIKLDSRGSVFFIHKRPGRNGQLFRIVKFRTMCLNATHRFHHLSVEQRREFIKYGKICTDPRVTRIGHWLRRYSLDELPQLWNVLRGDMSLIGPRPYLRSQVRMMGDYRSTILRVNPGLTGYWQVNGRNKIPFPARLQMDDYYVRNWTLWLDMRILIRTPKVMITGRGAY